MYYYLGMEACVRDNKYASLEKALEDAAHVSKREGFPIRIFEMNECNKSKMIKVVKPDGKIDEKVQNPEDLHNYTCDEFAGLRQILDEALDHIKKVPQLYGIYQIKGVEPALAEYLAWENPNHGEILKAIKEITPNLRDTIIEGEKNG